MVKFCLQCKNAFWGGQFCPKCEGEVELLDAANMEMIALRWDRTRRSVSGIGYRNLRYDREAGAGRR